jgi:hypothetical protein
MAHFSDANLERVRLSAAQSAQVFAQSEVLNAINSNDRIIVNDGIPVSKIAAYNAGNMRSFTIQPAETVAVPGVRGEQILSDGETLAINRPYFNANVPSALKQGVWPIAAQQQPVEHRSPTYIVNQIPYSYPSGDDENNNSVIYVDSAAQTGPPVPTVTTEGPQDENAPVPASAVSGGSYWSVTAEAPATVDTASAYMSPRQRSHERSGHKVDQPAGHREFNPPANGSHPQQHQENHPTGPEQRGNNNALPVSHSSSGAPSPSHSSAPSAPAHSDSGSSSHDENHGH